MNNKFWSRFFESRLSPNLKSKIENLKWLGLSVIAFVLVVAGPVAQAQQPNKIPRLGYLSPRHGVEPRKDAFRQGLRELGYIEGQNIVIEWRYAEGKLDRLPNLAAELVASKMDVIVAQAPAAVRAVKNATGTIPIIMAHGGDPVAQRFVASLARPGRNVTGLTLLNRDLSGTRLELLKEVVPTISRVGILLNAESTTMDSDLKRYEVAARALKVQLQALEVRGPNPDFPGAFHTAAKERVSALIALRNSLLNLNSKALPISP